MKRETGGGMGLAGQILEEMAARGARPVLVAEGLRISGAALARMALAFAQHLAQRGVGRGALVAVRSDDIVVSLCSVLATGMLGCRWAMAGATVGDTAGDMAGAADITVDTAPEGMLLPGAVLVDAGWSQPPMGGAGVDLPGPAETDAPWLILPGAGTGLSERRVAARLQAEAGFFPRIGTGVVGLAGPEVPEMLLLALATLFHGGVLVESADPGFWRAEGVSLVAGRPEGVAACMAGMPEGAGFRDLVLWADPGEQVEGPALRGFERVTWGLPLVSPDVAEPVPLALLDQVFEGVAGIAEAACFWVPKAGQGERLTAFLVLEPGADEPSVISEAKIAALRLGGKALVPGRFLRTEALPRLPDGSPDRAAARSQVLAVRNARKKAAAAGRGD